MSLLCQLVVHVNFSRLVSVDLLSVFFCRNGHESEPLQDDERRLLETLEPTLLVATPDP